MSWKAYQTYEDGAVVSWENDPKTEQPKTKDGQPDFSKVGPYSQTKIVDDLKLAKEEKSKSDNVFVIALVALAFAAISLVLQLKKKNQV